jgi:cysteine desulfurase/selenocysteine lyase
MPIDVARARAETPGASQVLHFNNAGCSLPPQPVLDAVIGYLQREATIGGYEAEAEAAPRLQATYEAVARLIGARPNEIALTDGASRAWAAAFYAIPFQPGDRILCSVAEYASNYIAFLQVAARTGAKVEVVPNDESGQLDLGALARLLDERVKLIAITHVPTSSGTVNPAEAVGRIARDAGALYLLDACQSVGQMALDVAQIGCDMLSATGRKYLRGPRGTGFLYVREAALDRLSPLMLDHHSGIWVERDRYELAPGATRFEFFEANIATRIGLGVAAEYALAWGLPAIEERVMGLAARLREGLSSIPGVTVWDRGARLSGIVTFTVAGKEPDAVKAALLAQGINVSLPQIIAGRLDLEEKGLAKVVRASVHYYNTMEEITRFCEAIASLAK